MADNDIAMNETDRLIASDKVEGTIVYNRQGERLGTIHNFMVDKQSGEVNYAVLASGGLFGMGGEYYPLPWKVLDYDTSQGGYVVDLDKDVLEGAPHYQSGEEPTFDRDYDREIQGHYGLDDVRSGSALA